MNLKCTLCNEEAIWDCAVLKSLICDGCCLYDMREFSAPEYIKLRTGKKMSWTEIISICSNCQHRQSQ